MQQTTCPAKIIRPVISDVLLRERLFQQIDGLRDRPTMWISAPGGAGKTSLISSYVETRSVSCIWYQFDRGDEDLASFFHYLGMAAENILPHPKKQFPQFTPEYFLGVDDFSRYFFTELHDVLEPSSMVVFDNCQEVADEALLYNAILAGQARLSVDMNIVFISRKEPPAQFSRQKANREIAGINWEEIRFTRDEFRTLANQLGIKLDEKQLQQIYTKLDGWAAGLPLLCDAGTADFVTDTSINLLVEESKNILFDYFAQEIFQHLNDDSQEILLQTCFLPYIDETLAEQVCGNRQAFATLQKLYRSNIFISLRSKFGEVYQYHQLFREFLLDRSSATLSTRAFNTLRSKAAFSLLENGLTEEAATLLIEANDWLALGAVINKEAALLLKQGRFQTLKNWLGHIPESIMDEDPWLLYWKGMCLMLQEPAAAMQFFNHAMEVFEKRQEQAGLLVTMLGIGDSLTYGFDSFFAYDQWVEKMETLLSREQSCPSPGFEARIAFIMLTAMAMRQPRHPRVSSWREKVILLLESKHDLGADLKIQMLNPLILHSILTGALPEARLFIDSFNSLAQEPGMPPLVVITLKNFEALYHWRCGNSKECYREVHEALKLSAETGIYVMSLLILINGACGALVDGELDIAKEYLGKIEERLERASLCQTALSYLNGVEISAGK